MADSRNEECARQYFNVIFNKRQPHRIGEFAHSDGIAYQTCGVLVGRQAVKEIVADRFLSAFPDLHIDVMETLTVGEEVVVRWHFTGTHLGPGLGIHPTGEKVTLTGITWLVFHDGRITKGWDCFDHGGLLNQLWRSEKQSATQQSSVGRAGPGA